MRERLLDKQPKVLEKGKFKGEIEPVEVRAGRHTKVVAADEPLENLSEINEDKIR